MDRWIMTVAVMEGQGDEQEDDAGSERGGKRKMKARDMRER